MLDIFHAAQHLAATAAALHGEGADAAARWTERGRRALAADGWPGLLDHLGATPAEGRTAGARASIDELIAYFAKHTGRLGYYGRLRSGRSIGSGAADGPAAEGPGPGSVRREHRRDGGPGGHGRHARVGRPLVTARRLTSRIESYTRIRRGPTQVRKFLTGMGLKCRKLGMTPARSDADVQRKFLDERLRPRLRQARRLRRVVCFVDAAHFVHGTFLGYLWCFARLLIRGPSGRKRFNVLGAIDAVTHELTTVCNDTVVNAETVCESLRTLAARYVGLPLTLVLDNARYQKCEGVRSPAAELGIELLYLPSYSPSLNLIERLWNFVKEECLSCRYNEDFARFKAAIAECLNGVEDKHRSSIGSLLTLNFRTFGEPQLLAG